jgi:hypothetical protein
MADDVTKRDRLEPTIGNALLRDRRVGIGQLYRGIRPDGVPLAITWKVTAVYVAQPHGIEHAQLQKVDEPSEKRTLATSVVSDRTRFRLES